MTSARLSMVYISLLCIKLTDINLELILKQMIRAGCGFYVSLYEKLGPHIPFITIFTVPAPPPPHTHIHERRSKIRSAHLLHNNFDVASPPPIPTHTPRVPKQDFLDLDKLTLICLSRRAMEFEWHEGAVQEAP